MRPKKRAVPTPAVIAPRQSGILLWEDVFLRKIGEGASVTEARALADEVLSVLMEKFPERYS